MTGEVGPAPNRAVHFGVNKVGLINVLGCDLAELPEWVQRLWVAFNVALEGGLSEELHMSQNLASPATTSAPEAILLFNLRLLSERSTCAYGSSVLNSVPSESAFFRQVNRFYADSFEGVCELCKEITRVFVKQIDLGLLKAKLDASNAAIANSKKFGSLKHLALWLNTLGLNGRDVTRPLAGIYDLRIGDAHATGKRLRDSLDLFGISRDSQDFHSMCFTIIRLAADSIRQLVDAVEIQFKATNQKP
jgi:hypothetical protein